MYKTRINKWGLDKKNKEHEARAILKLHVQRRGKPTEMRLRGRPVNVDRLQCYFKRKGLLIDDVLESTSAPQSNMDLVCKTPSPPSTPVMTRTLSARPVLDDMLPEMIIPDGTPIVFTETIPRRFEDPDGLKTVEYLFADIREYMYRFRHEGWWGEEGKPDPDIDTMLLVGRHLAFGHLLHLSRGACDLPKISSAGVGQIVRDTFIAINAVPNGRKMETIPGILEVISYLIERGQAQIAFALCKDISAVAASKDLLTNAVFGRIFSRMALLIRKNEPIGLISAATMRVTADSMKIILGLSGRRLTSIPTFAALCFLAQFPDPMVNGAMVEYLYSMIDH